MDSSIRITKDILLKALALWELEGRTNNWAPAEPGKTATELAAENIDHLWEKLEILQLPGAGG